MIKKILCLVFIFVLLISRGYSQKSPDEFFGLTIGADRTLVKYPKIIDYFKYIDAQSHRVQLVEEGKSTLGNPMYVAVISSEENIKGLPGLVEMNKKLTNADTISESEARELVNNAKVFILITCTIHSTEIASSQYAMLLAHQLATTNDPAFKEYLDNVVILLMPSINPDGNIMVTDWYKKYLDTAYEGSRMPYLYHHYAGHDNNRDFFMLNLNETRVVNAVLHQRYFPQIFLDMHQMGTRGPRMFVPPFKDPLNVNLKPLMLWEVDIIGTFMALKLQEKGKKGVGHSYAFDAWWPGGTMNTAWFKNVVGVLTELASANMATPIYIEPNELGSGAKGLPEYKAQVNFPDPWPGGWWRMKDIIEYETIAVDAMIEISSKNKKSFVANSYKMALEDIEKGKTEPPFGYIIPIEQWDLPASYTFLKKMREHGIRLSRLDQDARLGNRIYKKGGIVIPMAQPYREFIKVIMERQIYPSIKFMTAGPVIEPYDVSGWTMPLQMGVEAMALNAPLKGMKLTPITTINYPKELIQGQGDHYVIPGAFNRSAIVINRLFKKGVGVSRYTYTGDDAAAKPGDFLVKAADIKPGDLESLLNGTGVSLERMDLDRPKHSRQLKNPGIAIYQTYRTSMDEGWTRWVLDHFEFPYTIIHNKDFKDKQFSRKYDVVIFPDINRDLIVKGTFTSRFRGSRTIPPQYKGGIGEKGVAALKQLVKEGGTVVLMDSASELGISDFKLPYSNVLKNVKSAEFSCPGSILRISVDNRDPIGWGMPKDSFIYFSRSPAFRTRIPLEKAIDRKVVAGFKSSGPHLLSGYLKGGHKLDRAVMIMRFKYHKGNVIVLGGRVQNRSQTFGTFKFLFNALYYAGLKN